MPFSNIKGRRYLLIFLGCLVLLQNIDQASTHGMMLEPAQRSSLWRFNYTGAAINYDDNALFCGGFSNQWEVNDGKCGLCGDPFQDPTRPNEAGNKYGKGIIAKTYTQGEAITVGIELTANHQGYFEYRLCVHNNPTVVVTEDCFNNHLLNIQWSSGAGTRYPITSEMGTGYFTMTVQLPSGVTCSQCVLRWKYNSGNSWGCDAPGDCALGKGKQEQFFNCADIAITGSGTTPSTQSVTSPQTSSTATATTTEPTTTATTTEATTTAEAATTTASTTVTTFSAEESTTASGTTTTNSNGLTTMSVEDCPRGQLDCVSTPLYNSPDNTVWCNVNCNWYVRYCPESHCSCVCLA